MPPIIVWFRQDFRLSDHAPLFNACQQKQPIIPVFILDTSNPNNTRGAASNVWLYHSLEKLSEALKKHGSQLIIRKGDTLKELTELIRCTNAQAIYCHKRYEPSERTLEAQLNAKLDIPVHCLEGTLLHNPEALRNQQKKPYQVFTPFWKTLQTHLPEIKTLPAPKRIPAPETWPHSLPIESLAFLPKKPEPRWDVSMMKYWQVGETAAQKQLRQFLKQTVQQYETDRDIPAKSGTSRLSPYLHFGEISPKQVWEVLQDLALDTKTDAQSANTFLKEIAWREFSHHLLYHFPETTYKALRSEFQQFPWEDNETFLKSWQQGLTGYPIVDAGMRELWATGWMHNRVRMIVASFLVKNLMISWQTGAHWFWDTLVDADLAQNTFNWQWAAGCGADTAPYFRIFNPTLQGKKFDPSGAYVHQWIPELAKVPDKYIHNPWDWPEADALAYPEPIVDLSTSRDKALTAYKKLMAKKSMAASKR